RTASPPARSSWPTCTEPAETMLATFSLRLACGLSGALLLLPIDQVNPRFFRVHFWTVLGLLVVPAVFAPPGVTAGWWLALAARPGRAARGALHVRRPARSGDDGDADGPFVPGHAGHVPDAASALAGRAPPDHPAPHGGGGVRPLDLDGRRAARPGARLAHLA